MSTQFLKGKFSKSICCVKYILKAFANMSESQKKQVLEDWLTGMGESLPKAEQLLNTKYERTGMYDWDELCSKVIAFPLERLPMYEEYCELFKLLIPRIIRDWERFVDLNVSHPEKEGKFKLVSNKVVNHHLGE